MIIELFCLIFWFLKKLIFVIGKFKMKRMIRLLETLTSTH